MSSFVRCPKCHSIRLNTIRQNKYGCRACSHKFTAVLTTAPSRYTTVDINYVYTSFEEEDNGTIYRPQEETFGGGSGGGGGSSRSWETDSSPTYESPSYESPSYDLGSNDPGGWD